MSFSDDSRKKISYAASFGRDDVPSEYEEPISKLLQGFSYISVREIQGVKIVNELARKSAELVLDPTLLLDRRQWSEMADRPRETNYILVYLRQRSVPIARLAEALGRKTGLPVITIREVWPTTSVGKQVICPSPEKWLGYLSNAKYVITNSFHGIAFSINFNKQFFAVSLEHKGGIKSPNSRLFSILEQFELKDRLVTEETDLLKMPEIDFKRVNMKLSERRRDSLRYLQKALGLEG